MSKITEFNSFSNKFYTVNRKDDDTTSIVVKKNPDTSLTAILTDKGVVLPSQIVAYSKLIHSLIATNKKILQGHVPQLNDVIVSNNDSSFDKFRKNVGMVLLQLMESADTALYAPSAKCYHLIDPAIFNQFENLNPTAWAFGYYFRHIFGADPSLEHSPVGRYDGTVAETVTSATGRFDPGPPDETKDAGVDADMRRDLQRLGLMEEDSDFDDLFY